MSDVNDVEALVKAEVGKLRQEIDARFEDMRLHVNDGQDLLRSCRDFLTARVDDYLGRMTKAVSAVDLRVAKELAELRTKFHAEMYERIAQVSTAKLAESLKDTVVLTRPAQRHELAAAIPVRNATVAELRNK